MLDRESTFADAEIVRMLKTQFIPVAIDQAYQRRQKDTEGDFYRKIAGQGPRSNFRGTTQGFYIATPSGKLLLYNNNRDPAKVRRLMKEKLAAFRDGGHDRHLVEAIDEKTVDRRYQPSPPEGGLVVRVTAKVLGGYEPTDNRWRAIFQSALSRDNLWISAREHEALKKGEVLPSLQQRIARFHLVDNTRGEPPMWKVGEIRELQMEVEDGLVTGTVQLETADGKRGFHAQMRGEIEAEAGKVTRFDMVVSGDFWGEGPFTRGAPKGKFPLAIAFTLADGSDVADRIPPQGSRGWVAGYVK